MSHLKNWTKINNFYIDSQPEKIVTAHYRLNYKSDWKILSFWFILIIASLVVSLTSNNGYILMSLMAVFVITLMWRIDDIWFKDFKENNLLCLPYFTRYKFLHYIRFKNKCDEENIFNTQKGIVDLLDWQSISIKKFNTFVSFSSSKIHKASIAYFISVGVYFYSKEDFKIGFDIKIEHYLSILSLAVLIYFAAYWFYSVSRIHKMNDFKVRKFLEMYKKETN